MNTYELSREIAQQVIASNQGIVVSEQLVISVGPKRFGSQTFFPWYVYFRRPDREYYFGFNSMSSATRLMAKCIAKALTKYPDGIRSPYFGVKDLPSRKIAMGLVQVQRAA